ncbi:radical SAM protein [Bdellovibrionota bacterium]
MQYVEPVFRPPSEANSFILQVTLGCSNNKCTFCAMYRNKKFKIRPFEDIEEDIKSVAGQLKGVRRIFLADGDAMVLKPKPLIRILDCLHEHFPNLERVSIYTDAKGINNKTDEELAELKTRKLDVVYLGLESGSDKVLKLVRKGVTAEEMITAMKRAQAQGIKTSVIALLGLGGKELSVEHARETARVVSAMEPDYFSALTLTLVPGTELHEQAEAGEFNPLTPEESLEELHRMIELTRFTKPVIFRTNHSSNYLALQGTLPGDKKKILDAIKTGLKNKALRPEWMRGL